jgi:hypothetical protein
LHLFRIWEGRPALTNGEHAAGKREEIVIVHCSIVICHRWLRFARFFPKAAPKAHPKMTIEQ